MGRGEPELEEVTEEPGAETRRDPRRRKDKVTVDSLFKRPSPDRSPERAPPPMLATSSVALPRPQHPPQPLPASATLVSAMYPPVRKPVVTVVNKVSSHFRAMPGSCLPPVNCLSLQDLDSSSVATAMFPNSLQLPRNVSLVARVF